MTQELIELSKQAAEVLGIEPKEIYPSHFSFTDKTIHSFSTLWLAEDSGRCAEIAVDRGMAIDMLSWPAQATVKYLSKNRDEYVSENYSDHNGDRHQAWRLAVLKAVIEHGKQS